MTTTQVSNGTTATTNHNKRLTSTKITTAIKLRIIVATYLNSSINDNKQRSSGSGGEAAAASCSKNIKSGNNSSTNKDYYYHHIKLVIVLLYCPRQRMQYY
jgi:hypothetical protein